MAKPETKKVTFRFYNQYGTEVSKHVITLPANLEDFNSYREEAKTILFRNAHDSDYDNLEFAFQNFSYNVVVKGMGLSDSRLYLNTVKV